MLSPAKIYKHLFKRHLPYGLFSWRFLLPNQPAMVNVHRRIAMQHLPQIPRPLFLLIMLVTGCKWAFFHSPYHTFQAVRHGGKVLKEETGLSLWQQYWRVLLASTGHGLSPAHWYTFQLYQQKRNLWDYVYDQEASGFHAYRNLGRPLNREHADLLGDKWRFEKYLQEQKIPAAATITVITQATLDFRSQLEELSRKHGRLFCKRRTGNQGLGAFSAFMQGGGLQIQPRKGFLLPENEITGFLSTNNQMHDYLIQPEYKSHPNLQTTTHDYLHPASTIRIISHYDKGHLALEIAILSWPVINEEKNVQFHYPIAIQANSGILDKTTPRWPVYSLNKAQLDCLNLFINKLGKDPLPFWQEAIQLVQAAHPLFNGVDQIAWDFILSEERAVLLEGNSGWGGLAVCQWFGYDIKPYT